MTLLWELEAQQNDIECKGTIYTECKTIQRQFCHDTWYKRTNAPDMHWTWFKKDVNSMFQCGQQLLPTMRELLY